MMICTSKLYFLTSWNPEKSKNVKVFSKINIYKNNSAVTRRSGRELPYDWVVDGRCIANRISDRESKRELQRMRPGRWRKRDPRLWAWVVALRPSLLQTTLYYTVSRVWCGMPQSVAECCSVLQSVAECCRMLQSVADCCKVLQGKRPKIVKSPECVAAWRVLHCVALCCIVLQHITASRVFVPYQNTTSPSLIFFFLFLLSLLHQIRHVSCITCPWRTRVSTERKWKCYNPKIRIPRFLGISRYKFKLGPIWICTKEFWFFIRRISEG